MESKVTKTIKLQKELSKKVISKNFLPTRIKTVCGVDVSYKNDLAYCSAVILEKNSMNIIESSTISMKVSSPYIPGLFMLRESKPILKTLKRLGKSFDLLLVDGHGRLHPRKCGLACYIGIMIDKPVIGIAKRLLCGSVENDSSVIYDGKILGHEIKYNRKKIYVSVGHKISLRTAVITVKELTIEGWYPEPLRLADSLSKKFRKNSNN